MGFWGRVWSAIVGKMSIDEWWSEFGVSSSTSSGGIQVSQWTALQVSTVLACVAILSEDVAKLPVHVYRRRADGGKEIATDKNGKPHPVETLLQRPNDYQSRFEFFEQMQAALLLRSNAYAPIVRDGRGKPTALIPVNPDRVTMFESPDGSVFYHVATTGMHEIAQLRSFPNMIPAEDMLHLRWMSLDNSLRGASRVWLLKETIGLALSQQELVSRLAANGTNLGGVLSTDQKLSQVSAERLAKTWKERKGGLKNAGETAVLEQGLKWQQLGMTAQDAEINASRELSVLDIAAAFRVPPHKLGRMERMAGTSLEQVDQDYANNVISGHIGRWEDKLECVFDLAAEGLFVEFDLSRFLRAALQARYTAYRTGIVGMFLTPNEARRAEGLPDIEGGDTLYQPTNVAEIGFEPAGKETGPGSDVTGQPAPGGDGDPAAVNDQSAQD
jgi:HK97 family phage portal protein